MALDGIILAKVKEELDTRLPFRINRISQASNTEIVFNIHAQGIRTNLVISLHSIYNHLCLSDKNYTTYTDASTFIMVLRKYLQNGVIDKIEQYEYDRYLLLHVRALNDLYDEKEYYLSVELMGKYANLVLINKEDMRIIDALKKIPPYENNNRTILQGALFSYPQSQNKTDPFTINSLNLEDSLVKQYQGFSKVLENEIRYRLSNGEKYSDILKEISDSHSLYLSKVKDDYEYHVIPLKHLLKDYEEYPLFTGFEELYYGNDEKERIRNVTNDIFKYVKRQLKHYETKINKLNESLLSALNPESDRENADLLYTYSDLNKKGLKEITLRDYDDKEITINLDPRYSIKDNANRYYQTYQKKRKSISYIKEQLEIASNEKEYFTAISQQLSLANYNDALDIKEELTRYGYLRNKTFKQKKKKKIGLYQCTYRNYLITFGKNNLQNDFLTFDYAKASYMWFHAQGYHGSHLIVDCSEPDEDLIRTCANLAAWNSQGRYSGSVPVDYCLCKNIKKIKGAKAGFVSIRNQKTIYIDPEENKNLDIKAI